MNREHQEALARPARRLVDRELVELMPNEGYTVPDVFLRAWLVRLSVQHDMTAPLEGDITS